MLEIIKTIVMICNLNNTNVSTYGSKWADVTQCQAFYLNCVESERLNYRKKGVKGSYETLSQIGLNYCIQDLHKIFKNKDNKKVKEEKKDAKYSI